MFFSVFVFLLLFFFAFLVLRAFLVFVVVRGFNMDVLRVAITASRPYSMWRSICLCLGFGGGFVADFSSCWVLPLVIKNTLNPDTDSASFVCLVGG